MRPFSFISVALDTKKTLFLERVPLGILNLSDGWATLEGRGPTCCAQWKPNGAILVYIPRASIPVHSCEGCRISSCKRSTVGSVGQVEKDTSGDMGDGVPMLIRVY